MEATREVAEIVAAKFSASTHQGTSTKFSVHVPKAPPAVPVVLRVTEDAEGVKTMSSLDMVAYINSTREPGAAELRHDDFMRKVPTVIEDAPKFIGSSFYIAYGTERPRAVYNFPRREAMLMAMSYSYKLQATVYDAWQEAEAKVAAQAPVLFGAPTNYLDALKQLVASVEVHPWIRRHSHQEGRNGTAKALTASSGYMDSPIPDLIACRACTPFCME